VAWIVRVVKIGAEGEGPATDVMEIERPGDLADIAGLGLTLAETKRLLAGLQQEIVAAQVRDHAARRPACAHCPPHDANSAVLPAAIQAPRRMLVGHVRA
jgi:hypothetical protein